ncbi:MAG: ABC transporter ATP-binding protein [Acidobacteriota bacterium]
MDGPAIEVANLRRTFGENEAVAGVSFSVSRGEIFGLVGPDGAGKTTILRMLTAVLAPTSGEVRVLGLDAVRDGEAIKDRIGYMSQRFGLYPDLSVDENAAFYADLYGVGRAERDRRMAELLRFSGLAPFRCRRAGNLSGGMKQKLGLCCALIHSPEVLFLDEPTNGVDPVSRRDFWRILYRLLGDGVTILVSTAYLDEAERCSRVALLHEGRVIACSTPEGVKALFPGVLLSIRTPHARRAAGLLREAGLSHVAAYGDRIHAAVGETGEGERIVAEVLTAGGVSFQGVRPAEPSLEDVFMAQVARRGVDAREGGA